MRSGAVPHGPRDRTTVRRGLLVGGAVWAVCALGLAAVSLLGGLGGEAVAYGALLVAPLGGVAASLWIWLANLLDVLAGQPPSRRRWLWAVGLTLGTAFLLPAVLAASLERAG